MIKLKDNYYRIKQMQQDADGAWFRIALLPDCEVYQGHFPGNPVCPGACNIEMLKECMQEAIGERVYIESIKQCRLTTMATPDTCPEVELKLEWKPAGEDRFSIVASLFDSNNLYMEYKGEMSV